MAVEFHEADDEHAPFPHRVVIRPAIEKRIKGQGIIRLPKVEFVICAECDHWIMRVTYSCPCSQKCHELGEIIGNETHLSGVSPGRIELAASPEAKRREARSS